MRPRPQPSRILAREKCVSPSTSPSAPSLPARLLSFTMAMSWLAAAGSPDLINLVILSVFASRRTSAFAAVLPAKSRHLSARMFAMKFSHAVVACLLVSSLNGQTPTIPSGPPSRRALNANLEHYDSRLESDLQSLEKAALSSDYAYAQVAHLCDNIGPRLSGSPQAQAAVEYVADQLKRLGLEVTLEKVMVPHWVRGEETAALVEYPGQSPNTRQKDRKSVV